MYAVIDTETTGLSPRLRHRVVELAVVLVDERGEIESEFCTLLNPERDLGPQRIHKVRGFDVTNAPKFSDIAGHLLGLLAGRTLVAHNLPFDLTFLDAEFQRIGVPFPPTRDTGVCTMTWSSRFLGSSARSLQDCCAAAGVPLTGWHSALSDTRAAAGLLRHYIAASAGEPPWQALLDRNREAPWPKLEITSFQACSRSSVPKAPVASDALVSRLVDFMPRVDSSDVADPYLAVLDQALADRYISSDERSALAALASSLGLGVTEVEPLHHDYLNALARVALVDGHLSNQEVSDLGQVAEILGLPEGAVTSALEKADPDRVARPTEGHLPIGRGGMIVFTGDMDEPREVWVQRAEKHGYVPWPIVTKQVRLVVAADTDSPSGKARKARGYGIPVMSVEDFRTALGYPTPTPGERHAAHVWKPVKAGGAKFHASRPATDTEAVLEDMAEDVSTTLAGPSMIDGQPTRAPVIVAQRGDQVAIWQIDLAGNPCGAWVLPCQGVDQARRLLSICDRRALIALDVDNAVDVVLRLAKEGEISVDRDAIESRVCLLSSLVEETRDARQEYGTALYELGVRVGKRQTPLVWERPIPEPVPQTLEDWTKASGLVPLDVQSVADEARGLAMLARYALTLWTETEGCRSRRKSLRDDFGPGQPLPKAWREAALSAYSLPFGLPATTPRQS